MGLKTVECIICPISPGNRAKGDAGRRCCFTIRRLVADVDYFLSRYTKFAHDTAQARRLAENGNAALEGSDMLTAGTQNLRDIFSGIRRYHRQNQSLLVKMGQGIGNIIEQWNRASMFLHQAHEGSRHQRQFPAGYSEMGHDFPSPLFAQTVQLLRVNLTECVPVSDLVEHRNKERKGISERAVKVENGKSV